MPEVKVQYYVISIRAWHGTPQMFQAPSVLSKSLATLLCKGSQHRRIDSNGKDSKCHEMQHGGKKNLVQQLTTRLLAVTFANQRLH